MSKQVMNLFDKVPADQRGQVYFVTPCATLDAWGARGGPYTPGWFALCVDEQPSYDAADNYGNSATHPQKMHMVSLQTDGPVTLVLTKAPGNDTWQDTASNFHFYIFQIKSGGGE